MPQVHRARGTCADLPPTHHLPLPISLCISTAKPCTSPAAKKNTSDRSYPSDPSETTPPQNVAGQEFWSSRDFPAILGYTNYRNFSQVIQKAGCGQILWHFRAATVRKRPRCVQTSIGRALTVATRLALRQHALATKSGHTQKTRTACLNSGQRRDDHFVDATEMVRIAPALRWPDHPLAQSPRFTRP